MSTEKGPWLSELIEDFVKTSPENWLNKEPGEKAWDEVLVGFASGADPIFDSYKDLVGSFHWTPLEIFRLTFPDSSVTAADLTVISWILPQRRVTREDNRKETFYPADRWVQARFAGEDVNDKLRGHVVAELEQQNIKSVAPFKSSLWAWVNHPKYVFSSTWSERHAAYAAGLGTFGLCDGLITSKGKAHRVGSVVAKLVVPTTERPYTDHHAYCLYFQTGTCKACAKRCPVDAITDEGHNKTKCWDHAGGTCAVYVKERFGFDGYGCGLCQTGVPCESGIPAKIQKTLKQA